MNQNTRFVITIAAVVVITLVGALLVWAQTPQDQISAQGTTVEAIVRGGYSGWSRFDRPDTWYEETAVRAEVQNRDPSLLENTPGELARFTTHRGTHLCAQYDCGSWPAGTITQSLTIDGRQAVKYVLPTYDPGNGLAGEVYIDIDAAANSMHPDMTFLEMVIREAEDQQEYDGLLAELDAIVASYDFIDDYIDVSGWDETYVSNPQVLTLDEFAILHPSNFTVTETPTQVIVSSTGPTAGVSVTFEPERPQSDWDNAVDIFGVGGVRLIGDQVSGSIRVTDYAIDYAPSLPIRATAVIPNDPVGSPSYWVNDQTVWAIMSSAYFAYAPALLDPYP